MGEEKGIPAETAACMVQDPVRTWWPVRMVPTASVTSIPPLRSLLLPCLGAPPEPLDVPPASAPLPCQGEKSEAELLVSRETGQPGLAV